MVNNNCLTNTDIVKRYGYIILIIFTILEMLFHFSYDNLLGCIVFLYAWTLLSKLVLFKKNFERCLLPTLAITGFIFCYYFLPLIATFLEGKPLTYNFQVAEVTFFNMFLNITTVVLAYRLCLSCYRSGNLLESLWNRMGYFTPPNERQIWFFGIVGCALLFLGIFTQGDSADYMDEMQVGTDLSSVIMNLFKKYATMPICLYFCTLYGYNKPIKFKRMLIPFLILMSLIGVATTKRSMIFNAFATLGVIYLFIVIYENKKIFSTKNVIISFLAMFLITGPLADLALAMALNRTNMDLGVGTFDKVLELYQDKNKMETLKNAQRLITSNAGNNRLSWSEEYVDNIFLDRFCNIRVLDASVFYASALGYDSPKMHKYFKEEIVNRLPSPIVSLIGEKKVPHSTVADEMNNSYFNAGGRFWIGWKVSGDIGVGLYTFGYKYYPIAFIIYFIVFLLMSSYTKFVRGKFIIPTVVMVTFYLKFVYFDNAFGIYSSIEELMRGWINIIVYCIVLKIVKLVVR